MYMYMSKPQMSIYGVLNCMRISLIKGRINNKIRQRACKSFVFTRI